NRGQCGTCRVYFSFSRNFNSQCTSDVTRKRSDRSVNMTFDESGLVPAIVQDAQSKDVLTLAYMNEEALKKTIETRETWFYSRSREELWHKGETSGNTQHVVDVWYDCDQDALLVL